MGIFLWVLVVVFGVVIVCYLDIGYDVWGVLWGGRRWEFCDVGDVVLGCCWCCVVMYVIMVGMVECWVVVCLGCWFGGGSVVWLWYCDVMWCCDRVGDFEWVCV